MDIHLEQPKLVTVIPQQKTDINSHASKHKSINKINVSDYIVQKKKKLSKKLTKQFGDIINFKEKKNNNKDTKYTRKSSFTIKSRIKKDLLKEYKQQIKLEKKYRKIKITQNLSDSSEEESCEEGQNNGLELYISSESTFIFIFDILIAFSSFYLIFFIPLYRAERKHYFIEEKTIYVIFNIITEILYILDLIFCFFRTYYNYEYKKITETNKIILNYLTNDFLMDLLEAFPSYLIIKNHCYKNTEINVELSRFEIFMTILQILKSCKIMKVLGSGGNRAVEVLHEKIGEYYFFENLLNLFIFLFKIFSFLHILICIHIFLGWQNYPNWMNHINIIDKSLIIKYISSFYFIIETMTTVGYGDIICISPIERFFQLILLSIGIVSYSFIITKFGNYVIKKSNKEIESDKKLNQLEQIRIQYPLIPYKLYMKIMNYFRKKSEKKNNNNEIMNLINNLPDRLRNDMILVIYKNIINNFYIFKGCKNTDFITQLCSSFIQMTCEKGTILLMEGKKVENIIFVKEGRLILEAKINLSKPSESYKKYFRENFQYINSNTYNKMRNSVSQTFSQIDVKDIANNNYINYLEEKLLDKNKIGKRGNSLFNATNNSVSFQVGYESEEQEKENTDISKEGNNYQYLKILDIRKNEHFGDVFLFLDKPAPLTLKVISKIARIFILKKVDAIKINNIHHNIMTRIREKSFKNLIAIKKRTIDILKQHMGNKLNKLKRTSIQNTSWFYEKSRNNNLQEINNLLNNSRNLIEKGDLSPMSPMYSQINSAANLNTYKSLFKDFMKIKTPQKNANIEIKDNKENTNNIDYKDKTLFNMSNNNYMFRKKFGGIRKFNQTELYTISEKNNLLKINYEPKLIIKNNLNNKSFSLKTNLNTEKLNINKIEKNNIKNKSDISQKSQLIKSNNKKRVRFKCDQETESLSKDFNEDSFDDSSSETSSDLTQEEEKITTLNNIYAEDESLIRKKIKSSVQKEKILKLCRMQAKLIESSKNKIYKKSKTNENSFENIEENEFKKISDLNNIIYNKILEYINTEEQTDVEGEIKKETNNTYKTENTISFSIKSSYSNLNNLTKGKIIINNNYKIDIKNLIQNYIKEKNKSPIHPMKSFAYLFKKYYNNDNQNQEQLSFNNNSSPKRRKKVKFNIKYSSTNVILNKEKKQMEILSNKIKKTITNKIDKYKNPKNSEVEEKISQSKSKNAGNLSSSFKLDINNNINEKEKKITTNIFIKLLNSIYSKIKGK